MVPLRGQSHQIFWFFQDLDLPVLLKNAEDKQNQCQSQLEKLQVKIKQDGAQESVEKKVKTWFPTLFIILR